MSLPMSLMILQLANPPIEYRLMQMQSLLVSPIRFQPRVVPRHLLPWSTALTATIQKKNRQSHLSMHLPTSLKTHLSKEQQILISYGVMSLLDYWYAFMEYYLYYLNVNFMLLYHISGKPATKR